MKEKTKTTESIMDDLYKNFTPEKVDEVLSATSLKIPMEEFEKMDSSIKELYERLDYSKMTFEERKKIAFGIYIQELMEQNQLDKE